MNHTLVKDLPYVSTVYNRSRYINRLYKSRDRIEVYKVLVHGILKKFLNESDIIHIYCDADRRVLDEEIPVANWIMEELGPAISAPCPISLSIIFDSD